MGRGQIYELTVRLLVTIALLVYGFYTRDIDPSTGSLIIGAVIGHWLAKGEEVARRRHRRRTAAGPDDLEA